MRHLKEFELEQYNKAIVIGSGPSVENYSNISQFPEYSPDTLIVTVNYAPLRFLSHINFAQDAVVVKWLYDNYEDSSTRFAVIENALLKHKWMQDTEPIKEFVDYYFTSEDKYATSTTLSSALCWLLFTKPMPVYLYGFDGKDAKRKWYSLEVADILGKENSTQGTLDICEENMMKLKDLRRYVSNMNPYSNYTYFNKG